MQLEIKKIGDSSGLILPKELLDRLQLQQGDAVTITETPEGFSVSKRDEKFLKAVELAREGMEKYRRTMKALAK